MFNCQREQMFGKSKNFNSKFQFDLSQFTNNIGSSPGITRPNFGSLPPNPTQANGNQQPRRDAHEANSLDASNVDGTQFIFKPFQFHTPDSHVKSSNGISQAASRNPSRFKETFTAAALNPVSSQAVVFNAAKLPKEIVRLRLVDA